MALRVGMPIEAAGPVADSVTPTLSSPALAAPAATAATAATRRDEAIAHRSRFMWSPILLPRCAGVARTEPPQDGWGRASSCHTRSCGLLPYPHRGVRPLARKRETRKEAR